jgi:hypothetical protein
VVHIVGATNPRPIIKLKTNALGYESGKMKPIFWLYANNREGENLTPEQRRDPENDQPNINFNMVIRSMVFDLSENPGALALRFAGAQGATIEDIKVLANKAYAGFYNCVGQGGGNYNLEVEGGKYAWHLDDSYDSEMIILSGIVCRNQETSIIRNGQCASPILLSGFHLEMKNTPIINKFPSRGGITMIDGIIDYTSTLPFTNVFPASGNSLYMKNVYVRNCEKVILSNTSTSLNPSGWNEIKELSYIGTNSASLINGELSTAISTKMELGTGTAPEPMELIRKHSWDPLSFISIGMRNDANFVNVKDAVKMTGAPGIAKGDNTANDTKAIQWAIDHFEKVYLPYGTYRIDSTLYLRSKTQLTGAGKVFTIIQPLDTWKANSPKIMVKSIDDVNATTCISFVMLQTNPLIHKDMVRLNWQAGANSMIRDIIVGVSDRAPTSSIDHQILKISGPTAGGRIYAFAPENGLIEEITRSPLYRAILIENTTQPLRFYGLNTERISSGVQVEIRNSSNVDIHYFKSEATSGDQASSPLLINNSHNINLYCMAGKINIKAGMALVRVEGNSTNTTVTCVKDNNGSDATSGVKEIFNSVTKSITRKKNVGLFYRSESSPSAPTGNAYQTFCKETVPTVANLVAIGNNIKWYATASGGEAIPASKALVSGTHYYGSQTVGGIESSLRLFVIPSVEMCTGIKENTVKFRYFVKNNEIQLISPINKSARAIIYDLQGRTMKMTSLKEGNFNSISILGFKSGIYLLKVIDGMEVKTMKIIINI